MSRARSKRSFLVIASSSALRMKVRFPPTRRAIVDAGIDGWTRRQRRLGSIIGSVQVRRFNLIEFSSKQPASIRRRATQVRAFGPSLAVFDNSVPYELIAAPSPLRNGRSGVVLVVTAQRGWSAENTSRPLRPALSENIGSEASPAHPFVRRRQKELTIGGEMRQPTPGAVQILRQGGHAGC